MMFRDLMLNLIDSSFQGGGCSEVILCAGNLYSFSFLFWGWWWSIATPCNSLVTSDPLQKSFRISAPALALFWNHHVCEAQAIRSLSVIFVILHVAVPDDHWPPLVPILRFYELTS